MENPEVKKRAEELAKEFGDDLWVGTILSFYHSHGRYPVNVDEVDEYNEAMSNLMDSR